MEPTLEILAAQHFLYITAIVLAVGSFCGFIASRIGVPDIVLFLLVGMLLGPTFIGAVDITTDSVANQLILLFGASYILFDGGLAVRFAVLKKVWVTIVVIATLGVCITAVITGLAAQYLLGLPLIVALLLGATIAPTDPATLVPIFKQVKIRASVQTVAVTESAFNDAMGAIIAFSLLGIAMAGMESFSLGEAVGSLLWEALIGLAIGAIMGYVAAFVIAHEKYGFLREYLPLVTLMVVIGSYLEAGSVHASGFMAVFVAGLILGNKDRFGFKLEHHEEEKMEDFVLTTGLIFRMFIFMLLGAQVDFALLGQYWLAAVGVVLVFMFIARPITVFVCAAVDRKAKWTTKELLFLCWVRESGVIPGALAGMFVGAGAPNANIIAAVTFMAILMTIVIQATTTKWLAGKLGLLE